MSQPREPYLVRDYEFARNGNHKPPEARLIEHLAQFRQESCKGAVIIFTETGYKIFAITREKTA